MKFRTTLEAGGAGEGARVIKDLIQRHWHLDSVGFGNCRAAQAILRELNEKLLLYSAALANANFNPDEPRDSYGEWTTGDTSTTKTPTSPTNNAPPQTAQDKPSQAVLRPFTPWEKLTFDLRQLKFKLLPGTRPSGQPSPGKVIGAAAMLLPGVGEATVAETLPAALAIKLRGLLPLIADTKLSQLLLAYFTAKTASEQPAYYRAIKQELAQGNYSSAIRGLVADALQIAAVVMGIAGERGGTPSEKVPEESREVPAPTSQEKVIPEGQKTRTTDAQKKPDDSIPLQPYGGSGGGHHPVAKSLFKGNPLYDFRRALAISNAELARLKVRHELISAAQNILYRAFGKTHQKIGWEAIEDIETEALIRGGLKSEAMARSVVKRVIRGMKAAGIKPTRIPWGD